MIKVACIQPKIYETDQKCYDEVERLLVALLKHSSSCDIICLPEKWIPLKKNMSENIQEERGHTYNFIKQMAKEFNVAIISGAIWEKRDNNKSPKITAYFFDKDGNEIGRQDKIHLYSYEREVFEPGNELNIFNYNNFNFSILICFDMAFFETPRLATENGAEILFSPTQIRADGMKNWEVYLKARALENRIPVVACNTFGSFKKSNFLGHSKIISFIAGFTSPSKLRIIEAPLNNHGFVLDEIDLNFPKKLREIRFKEKVEKNEIKINKIN
jgi:predicted amidohydrolase